jgi:DNA polymerase III subunit alpha
VLEGLPRHASTHAAGVVIGDKPLVEYLPLYRGKKGEVVTQFDMKLVEKIGLVKFDFLGLRNLTVIDHALKLIGPGQTPPDSPTSIWTMPPPTPALRRRHHRRVPAGKLGHEGSAGAPEARVLRRRHRPGGPLPPRPPGQRHGGRFRGAQARPQKVEYMLPQLEPILKETYGVIVYQEQVMKIAGALASYTMAEADGLRKAMGKKIAAMMAEHRDRFVKGAVENGIPRRTRPRHFRPDGKIRRLRLQQVPQRRLCPDRLPDRLPQGPFSGGIHGRPADQRNALHRRRGQISSPNAAATTSRCCRRTSTAAKASPWGNKIRFGLVAVKNVGEGAIDAIMEERRANGPFTSLFDFCERVDLRKVNKRVLESLIKCGAFDSTGAPVPR